MAKVTSKRKRQESYLFRHLVVCRITIAGATIHWPLRTFIMARMATSYPLLNVATQNDVIKASLIFLSLLFLYVCCTKEHIIHYSHELWMSD